MRFLSLALLFVAHPAFADVSGGGCRCSGAGLPALAAALPIVGIALLFRRR